MSDFVVTINEAELAAILADYYAASNDQRPNDFTPTNPSVINTVNVGIAPPIPTAGNLQPTIEFAQAVVADSVAEFGTQETPLVVTLLETLDDAGALAGFLTRPAPAFWFGNIQVIMNGLTDAQRTTINSLDIGSQVSVTKSFPNSTPSTVTQLMALEGISHDISPDRHIVTLYPNPARIYTYFIVGGYTTTTTRTNLVTNPNFETNTTEWSGVGSSTLSQSSTSSYVGTYSLLVTDTSTGLAGASTTFTPTNGISYTLSFYVKNTAGLTRNMYAQIGWSGGTFSTGTVTSVPAGSGWVRLSVTGTAPNSSLADIYLVTSPGASTETTDLALIDAVLIEASSSLLPYFDGTYADTYTGYTLESQAWNGTANASTSTATWGLTSSFVGSELNDDTKGLG